MALGFSGFRLMVLGRMALQFGGFKSKADVGRIDDAGCHWGLVGSYFSQQNAQWIQSDLVARRWTKGVNVQFVEFVTEDDRVAGV